MTLRETGNLGLDEIERRQGRLLIDEVISLAITDQIRHGFLLQALERQLAPEEFKRQRSVFSYRNGVGVEAHFGDVFG